MIDRTKLLTDLQGLLRNLEADLLERSDLNEVLDVGERLRLEYQQAKQAKRTAQNYEDWLSDYITHIAAAWVLSAVFARFLEDNKLTDPPMLAGAKAEEEDRLQRARDEHEVYFRSHPKETDREYLLFVFGTLAKLSGAEEIFGEHNPVYEFPNWLSGDAAGELLKFFQRINPATGTLIHDFADPNWDTRFLGNLYQDLSERARKKYALLQTPEFVEAFILDRTLDPAINEFGLEGFRMIDPACGSGHFLLGSFHRLLDLWQRKEPATNVRALAQRALDSVYGVDINPYAVSIARFRLLLAAMKECHIERLVDAPAFRINLACGDSLLHGESNQLLLGDWAPMAHHFHSEDAVELNRILVPGGYHAVVANPPYITVKDQALNQAYRDRYSACHRQYSLSVPFMQRIFGLAVQSGFTGQITANSFMKREFGKKLIEELIPNIDLTHVIDTSGAYIPGHGTPTVILFGRNRKPVASTIRAVMGIRGEPSTPENPAEGLVWSAILDQVDQAGSQSEFVSVADSVRESFCKHPWSIGGGGASDLKEWLDKNSSKQLSDLIEPPIGRAVRIGEEEVFIFNSVRKNNSLCSALEFRGYLIGENLRDWASDFDTWVWYPYTSLGKSSDMIRQLWYWRTALANRSTFQGLMSDAGLTWFDYMQHTISAYKTPLSIAFAFISTHNHFVLDRGGKVFKQSAPVIKLPADATEDEHLALLGLLNSSTACFWMKQVCQNKGATSDKGVLQADPEKFRFEFDGTKLSRLPIPSLEPIDRQCLIKLTNLLEKYGCELSSGFTGYISNLLKSSHNLKTALKEFMAQREKLRDKMVRLQEELDWLCYEFYGLLSKSSEVRSRIWTTEPEYFPVIAPDARPYRVIESDIIFTLDSIDQARVQLIRNDSQIKLLESPEYKRRWFRSAGAYDDTNLDDSILLERNVQSWLLDRLETYFDFDGRMNADGKPTAKIEISLVSIAQLADLARQDADFMQVGELYRNDSTFNVQKLIIELVEAESVPLLSILRYKPTGLRKRAEWETTWELQRLEDAIDARTKLPKDHPDYLPEISAKVLKQTELSDIPVPPKFTSTDFQKSHYWKLRGKLDVPKERWISFPYCEGNDGTLMIAWAGYNHLQLALAISAYYVDVQERIGGRDDPRLLPLLAGLIELLPWLKQWHNDIDHEYNTQMGDYFEGFIQDEAHKMGRTPEQIRAWEPPQRTERRR